MHFILMRHLTEAHSLIGVGVAASIAQSGAELFLLLLQLTHFVLPLLHHCLKQTNKTHSHRGVLTGLTKHLPD